jgi:hypothetical protein
VENIVPEAIDTFKNYGDDTTHVGMHHTELIIILIAGLQDATKRI